MIVHVKETVVVSKTICDLCREPFEESRIAECRDNTDQVVIMGYDKPGIGKRYDVHRGCLINAIKEYVSG